LGSETKKKISILAPLVHLTKADIVRLGLKLNAPMEATWSFYQGGRTPCGRCDACLLRERGFKSVLAKKKGRT
jgi:7-cyano-7-deazaguanine synthase